MKGVLIIGGIVAAAGLAVWYFFFRDGGEQTVITPEPSMSLGIPGSGPQKIPGVTVGTPKPDLSNPTVVDPGQPRMAPPLAPTSPVSGTGIKVSLSSSFPKMRTM